MNTIPAQAIKQRGIGAVDELLVNGPVHVITRNKPRYVVMDEAQYAAWQDAQHEAFVTTSRAALEDVKAGRVHRFASADAMLEAIRTYTEE